jgi:hypothetical protein
VSLQEAFKSDGYATVFMDVWDEQEIRQCRDLFYPHMRDDEVFGGTGRFTR